MALFEFVPHTADIALRAEGEGLTGLLRAAALGVTAASLGQDSLAPRRVPGATARPIRSEGAPDEEGILVDFLNEVIFQAEVNGELYADIEILACDLDQGVDALAYPDPALAASHAVKAATYYDLHVTHRPDGAAEATIVFDV